MPVADTPHTGVHMPLSGEASIPPSLPPIQYYSDVRSATTAASASTVAPVPPAEVTLPPTTDRPMYPYQNFPPDDQYSTVDDLLQIVDQIAACGDDCVRLGTDSRAIEDAIRVTIVTTFSPRVPMSAITMEGDTLTTHTAPLMTVSGAASGAACGAITADHIHHSLAASTVWLMIQQHVNRAVTVISHP